MIQASDLRIGNWYYLENPMAAAKVPEQFTDWTQALDFEAYGQPIPITSELLERCGFEGQYADFSDQYVLGDLLVEFIPDMRITARRIWDKEHSILLAEIRYLHQLQNLFYCMNGMELLVPFPLHFSPPL
jgi:hypothetical protein